MKTILDTIFVKDDTRALQVLLAAHPYLAYTGLFLGMPAAILLAVTAFTTAVIVPLSIVMGWPL